MIPYENTSSTTGHILIENLRVRFGRNSSAVEAVSDVSMEVKPGEFVSIIGPSGCGKSTLLNVVAGFVQPSAGSVTLDGKSIEKPGADRGMVFQQYSLFPWLTVRKNVEFGLKQQGMETFQREQAARTLLGLAGLLAFENHFPEQLSGGMKQRVGIVRALATSPQVLLMDEPFGALDALTRAHLQDELMKIAQATHSTVMMVTHDVDEAVLLSDRIVMLTNGPAATIGEILSVDLARPRDRLALAEDPHYHHLRGQVLEFLYHRQMRSAA